MTNVLIERNVCQSKLYQCKLSIHAERRSVETHRKSRVRKMFHPEGDKNFFYVLFYANLKLQ